MGKNLNHNGKLVITIDVEDWQQSTLNQSLEISDHSAKYLESLLMLLSAFEKKATMFVLGKFAEKFPYLVKKISNDGHEVACHGYSHIQIFKQTPKEFSADINRSKKYLEDLIGKPVLGYRAPDFSIINSSIWALKILSEHGFEYDSSIFPIDGPRYGIKTWPLDARRVILDNESSIIEIPPSTLSFFGHRFPVAGGGYHRLFPYFLIKFFLKKVWENTRYFVSYCHPYEFYSDELRQINHYIPPLLFLSQNIGRKGFEKKFCKFINHDNTLAYLAIREVKDEISIVRKFPS